MIHHRCLRFGAQSLRVVLSIALSLATLCMAHRAHAAAPIAVELDEPDAAIASDPPEGGNPLHVGPVGASGPSQTFVAAERAHVAGEYQEAALKWHRIVQRATPDDRGHRELAEYQLSTALARLGLLHASVSRLREAAENPEHLMHRAALIQLGKIAQGLPEISGILPLFAGYAWADLDRLRKSGGDESANLSYFIGRGLYEKGDYVPAQSAFAGIASSNPHFLESRLFESACHVRQRHAIPALQSLRRGVIAVEQGEVRTRDRQRWLDLLHLAEARIYYSSAMAFDAETNIPAINQTRVSAAVKYYNMVEPESEYYAEATFELAWIYFMAGQHTFALGKIFTLETPFYEDQFYPEAQILKSVIYLAHCNYDAATIVSARFNKRYMPIREATKQLLRQYNENEPGRFLRVIEALRHRGPLLGPALEPTLRSAYRHRGFQRRLRAADAVEAEVATLGALPAGWQASELGAQLRGELDLLRQAAALSADQWLRGFLQRRIDEIDEHVRNGDKVQFFREGESRNLLDIKLKSGQVSRADSNDWGRVFRDEEHVIWPFDGEYWRDEIGSYRVSVFSTCGR